MERMTRWSNPQVAFGFLRDAFFYCDILCGLPFTRDYCLNIIAKLPYCREVPIYHEPLIAIVVLGYEDWTGAVTDINEDGFCQADALQAKLVALDLELQATKTLLQTCQGGGGDAGSLLPRSMRLDVPKFLGIDPESWIFSITEYFSLLNTPVDQRLRIVGFNLEGEAAEWFRWMTRNGLITNWDAFVDIAQYQSEFEKLMNRVTDISENLLISFYVSGLKPNLQREVLVAKPTNLGDAFALARVTEARLDDQRVSVVGQRLLWGSQRRSSQRGIASRNRTRRGLRKWGYFDSEFVGRARQSSVSSVVGYIGYGAGSHSN
ncbi:hypothetical protein Tco_0321632 [Tanacetum coccineum]